MSYFTFSVAVAVNAIKGIVGKLAFKEPNFT